jgi:hypothetical protein
MSNFQSLSILTSVQAGKSIHQFICEQAQSGGVGRAKHEPRNPTFKIDPIRRYERQLTFRSLLSELILEPRPGWALLDCCRGKLRPSIWRFSPNSHASSHSFADLLLSCLYAFSPTRC